MNTKFDELTKNLAQAVTRRAALKQFGVGLAGMALACFGLANKAEGGGPHSPQPKLVHGYCQADPLTGKLTGYCAVCGYGYGFSAHGDCGTGTPATQVSESCGFFSSGTKCSLYVYF